MDKYKDEFGLCIDNNILESDNYINSSIDEKNKFLLSLIEYNNKCFSKLTTDNDILEYTLPISEEKKTSDNEFKKEIIVNTKAIEEAKTREELLLFLPQKDDANFSDKINLIKSNLRLEEDIYDSLIRSTDDIQSISYLLEYKNDIERKSLFISDYEEEIEQIYLEKESNMDVVYFISNGCNFVLDDLLNEDIEKYSSYSLLINSIKDQTFKRLKRLNSVFYNLYEVRNDEQRIIFDFISKDVIIIIQAFTKKVWVDKKYRLSVKRRAEKYINLKESIVEDINGQKRNICIKKLSDNDNQIDNLLQSRNKVLTRRMQNGRNN